MKTITIDPNTESELEFKVSLKGSGELPPDINPEIRFLLMENSEEINKFYVYWGEFIESGVLIYFKPTELDPKKQYIGKLEIILGKRYFNPITVMVDIQQPEEIEVNVDEINSFIKTDHLDKVKSLNENKININEIVKQIDVAAKHFECIVQPLQPEQYFQQPQQQKPLQSKPKTKEEKFKEKIKILFKEALKS